MQPLSEGKAETPEESNAREEETDGAAAATVVAVSEKAHFWRWEHHRGSLPGSWLLLDSCGQF